MEFKNCEERVLWELDQAENEIVNLRKKVEELEDENNIANIKKVAAEAQVKELRELMGSILVIKESSGGELYIDTKTSYIWESYDHDLYRRIVDNVPEIEVKGR